MILVGMDVSTYVGIVRLDTELDEAVGQSLHFDGAKGFDRLQLIAGEIKRVMKIYQPDGVVIENYGFGNRFTLATLVEIGTIVRWQLHGLHIPWINVSPTVLKKWVTGKGNAKKPDMAKAVYERWGYKSPSDDVIDAYCLARYGEANLRSTFLE